VPTESSPGIEVLEQHLAARHLDVAHHHRRGVHARRFAHEIDRALAVHGELTYGGDACGERAFHRRAFMIS
jgi:hypothetical protein